MLRQLSPAERANSLTHAVGVVLSVAGLCFLAYQSLAYRDPLHTAAVCLYGVTLVSVFTSSTLHHAATSPRLKRIFLWLDHSCIYALIAGTYTPFMLVVLRGTAGTAMLGTVWGLGVVGIVSKTVLRLRSDLISILFYLFMGWLGVLVIQPVATLVGAGGLALLVAGGLCYTVGIAFFLMRHVYAHAVWHVFVLAGSALHYACILLYATPA
jgi:hemolysin III